MQIFKILMSGRIYGWTYAGVEALNLIEVIFAKDQKVITQWKKYYDVLCVENPDAAQHEKMVKERDALLEVMAISLGYKDNVTLRTIQNAYHPVGLAEMLKRQAQYQDKQFEIMNIITHILNAFLVSAKINVEEQPNGQATHGNPGFDSKQY